MRVQRFLMAGALILVSGCGVFSAPLHTVSGVVQVDGQPLPGAGLVVMPDDGKLDPRSSGHGTTDEQGKFTIENGHNDSGLPAGLYRVAVIPPGGRDSLPPPKAGGPDTGGADRPSSPGARTGKVPPDYLSQESTPVRMTISGPVSDFQVAIPSGR